MSIDLISRASTIHVFEHQHEKARVNVNESIEEIERAIPKQLALADTIQANINNSDVTIYDIMIKADGIYAPNIKTTSWNAISNSRIELVAYKKLSALAEIADRKENIMNRVDRLTDFIFQNFEETDKSKKQILNMMVLDAVGAESRLKEALENMINNEPLIN